MNQTVRVDENQNEAFDMALQKHQQTVQHYAEATPRFLTAWKKAIELIGPEYFHCEAIENYRDATERGQIRPIADAIEHRINTCSVGEGVFIGAVCSFYNGKWGAGISDCFGYHGIGDIANRLDLDYLEVIIELTLSHTGW